MNVLEAETYLHKPSHYLILTEVLRVFFGFFDELAQISARCILHNDIKFLLHSPINLPEPHNIIVI